MATSQVESKMVEKTPAKPIKKTAKIEEKSYEMPKDVKDWIDRAHSIINRQTGEIERLKKENGELKSYKKWAEHMILRSDYE